VATLTPFDLTWLTIKEFHQACHCDLRFPGSRGLILRTNPEPQGGPVPHVRTVRTASGAIEAINCQTGAHYMSQLGAARQATVSVLRPGEQSATGP